MDWKLQAARWVLGRIPGEDLPQIATEAMVLGDDSPSLVQLAAESGTTIREAGPLFLAALHELEIDLPDRRTAIFVLARELAERIVAGQLGVHDGAHELALLSYDATPSEALLSVFVGLVSELDDLRDPVRLDWYGSQACAEGYARVQCDVVEACRALLRSEPANSPAASTLLR